MSGWVDVSSAAAGAMIFVIGALVPKIVTFAEDWINREEIRIRENPAQEGTEKSSEQ